MIDKLSIQEDLEKELFPAREKLENCESCFHGHPVARPPYPRSGLHGNELLYRHLIEHMNEGFAIIEMVFDEQGRPVDYVYREVNSSYEQQTGHSREQLVGRSRSAFFPPLGGECYRHYSKVLSSCQFMRFEEFCPTRNRCFDIRAYPLPRVNHLAVITSDVTERKKAEKALRLSEEKFSKSFHGLPILMVIATLNEGRLLDVNDTFCRTTGFNRDELIGRTSADTNIINTEKRMEFVAQARELGKLEDAEIELYSKSGDTLNCLFWSQLIDINGESCHITGIIDISDRKRLENAISRLERLNLIGEMAASIGHEIRNPMTAIRGFLQLLGGKQKYRNDRIYFELMIEELDRANAIISEYLSMAKDKRVDLQLESLDSIVASIYPMIQSDANRYDMNLGLELGQLPPTPLDPKEVRQLILNIARNGLEAMSPGGTLTIGTTLNEKEMVLFIRDEGPGLDQELLEKLGTPFITTKENGTGLGLAVCYSIAARHQARIEFDTGPCGTTFYIKFPS